MLHLIKLYLIFGAVLIKSELSSMELFEVDVNDILNERFMPVSLFLQRDQEVKINNTRKHFYQAPVGGDFSKALTTMRFHRQKMNEYLCSNFVADEIIRDLAPQVPHIERRMGKVDSFSNISILQNARAGKNIQQEALLFDQGSSGYRNWLAKTTTLDDIQQQIKQQTFGNQTNNVNRSNNKQKSSTTPAVGRRQYQGNEEDDFYEEGDVTGYAMHKPLQPDFPDYSVVHNRDTEDDFDPERSENIQKSVVPSHNIAYATLPQHTYYYPNYDHTPNTYHTYPSAADGGHTQTQHEGYFQGGQEVYEHDHGVQHHQTYAAPSYNIQDYGQGKELGIKDFIDIALTTLAFLSFGMFILQVLMCITMNKTNNNLMMMPMEIDNGGEVEEIRRKRSLENERMREVNEISRRVLVSIEALLHAKVDNGECLQKVICTNNGYAREQKDGRRIWVPVWSLGLSWLSARFVPAKTSISSALNNLKAAAIGLGGGSCEHFYSSCNFKKIIEDKQRFRTDERGRENYKFKWSI